MIVFFGFTQCPDVCPTTLLRYQRYQKVMRLLEPRADRLQVLFVTIDPERDAAPVLKAYLGQFDPRFMALRGSAEELLTVARTFRVTKETIDGLTPTNYTMNHSTFAYCFDTQGQPQLFFAHKLPAEEIAGDLRHLIPC